MLKSPLVLDTKSFIGLKLPVSEIAQNIAEIKRRIKGKATLLAVVKNIETNKIFEALEAGINVIGENRIQEAASRIKEIRKKYPAVKIHFIGHLQSNKVNQALEMFDVIESVDSVELAQAISKRAKRKTEIFIEVNTSGEESKFGVEPTRIFDIIRDISGLPNLEITGLMTIGALTRDKEKIRSCFKLLRELRDNLNKTGFANIKYLSMGMSRDFEIAIEEGSDIIRIGTAIFGRR